MGAILNDSSIDVAADFQTLWKGLMLPVGSVLKQRHSGNNGNCTQYLGVRTELYNNRLPLNQRLSGEVEKEQH